MLLTFFSYGSYFCVYGEEQVFGLAEFALGECACVGVVEVVDCFFEVVG